MKMTRTPLYTQYTTAAHKVAHPMAFFIDDTRPPILYMFNNTINIYQQPGISYKEGGFFFIKESHN